MQQYPCIGQWTFLISRTPDLPWYEDMVNRVRAGAVLLDVGCGFGQDLRYMAADGVPTQKMYSSDIVPKLWDIGYELYRDGGSMKAHFLEANILDPESAHKQLSGEVDILLVNQIFHLFDWDRQLQAGKNMVALSRTGTWIMGWQIGSALGRAVPVRSTTGGTTGAAGSTSRFFHTPDTWKEMWRQVQEETGSEWVVESSLHNLREWGLEDEDLTWMGPAARGFEFIVRRIDNPGSKE